MRHVFLLIDGTNCVLASGTNIRKIHDLSKNSGYGPFYHSGVGAFSRTWWMDVALAPDIERRAMEVFQTIVSLDLEKDDRLYIFGYSRGAIIARTLAMCIVSKEYLRSVARHAVFTESVHAQIEFLCLFDPVIGRPRLFRPRINDHDAILEPKVKTYLELLSVEEGRPHYPSASYSASKKTMKKIRKMSSTSTASTTADRQQSMAILEIRKTRKAIWFPGKHADVGGHGRNKEIGLCTLAAVLNEFDRMSKAAGLKVSFSADEVQGILNEVKEIGVTAKVTSNPLSLWFKKVLRSLGKRKPTTNILVQHFGHPICKKYHHLVDVFDEIPEYPL